jgi:hypothetical protein
MTKCLDAFLLAALLPASPALAASPESPAPPTTNLTINPTIACREGDRAEYIRLSRANGDAIDGVFAFCRDSSLSSEAWIARLETTRDKLIAGSTDDSARTAIRHAFDEHIARERAEN